MVDIGLQASHEQFSPRRLLKLTQQAEAQGFDSIMASDHIAPWSNSQDNSAFTWSWLGAALQSTSLTFSSVSVPGWRYHPVILAQAIATLCHMYPGRFEPYLGSGEALNEHVVGEPWPDKALRHRILQESVTIMRKLWKGETVSHFGAVTVDKATLYTLPSAVPRVYGAALTSETAAWLGEWTDGLVTIADSHESASERVEAYIKHGGHDKPITLKADFAYGSQYDEVLTNAHDQWRFLLLPSDQLASLRLPQDFEAASKQTTKQVVAESLPIFTHTDEAIAWLQPLLDLPNVTKIILHNVTTNQEEFVTDFGERVLPALRT